MFPTRSARRAAPALFLDAPDCLRVRTTDSLLLLACAALALAGPAMAVQEYAKATQARGLEDLTSEPAPIDYSFRDTWRVITLALVLVVGLLGSVMLVRVGRAPRVRSVSARLLVLLTVGMALLDLTYLLDRANAGGGFLVRLITVSWLYPAAAIVIALSASRLAELEAAFAEPSTPVAPRVA